MNVAALLGYVSPYYENNSYYYTSHADAVASGAFTAVMFLFMFVFIALAYVITALLVSRIFKKAGEKSWKAWVPVYNSWTLLELGDQQGFWAVLAFIPVVNIVSAVFVYIAQYNIGLKLGKQGAFVLWAIFLPIVWYVWLALDDSKWKHTASKTAQ